MWGPAMGASWRARAVTGMPGGYGAGQGPIGGAQRRKGAACGHRLGIVSRYRRPAACRRLAQRAAIGTSLSCHGAHGALASRMRQTTAEGAGGWGLRPHRHRATAA